MPRWTRPLLTLAALSLFAGAAGPGRPAATAAHALAGGPVSAGLPRSFATSSGLGTTAVARWDPCTPVRWRLNPAGMPSGALADVRGAVARIEAATGLDLVYDGITGAVPDGDLGRGHDATQDWPALTIAFVAPGTTRDLPRAASGVGGWHAVSVSATGGRTWVPRIVTGFVLLDRRRAAGLPRGFGGGGTLGQLLMHELGHAVGLGHVSDPREVMYPRITTKRAAWGRGDLAGLAAVGVGAGCLPALPPLGASP